MSKYFKITEFECKCGCGLNNIDNELLIVLEQARHLAGVPFKINSGCRCKKHNDSLPNSSPTSSHVKGLAVDIKCDNDEQRFYIINGLMQAKFLRIGIAKTFIHADIDNTKNDNRIWIY